MERLRRAAPYAAGFAAVAAVMAVYYAAVWRSLEGFVRAIDKNPRLFEDLLIYFHPMGRDIFLLQTPIYGYFYPAFSAVLLAPLGVLEYGLAHWIWGALQVAAFAGVCLVPLRRLLPLSPVGAVFYFALCFSSLPALHNFSWGQVGMFLTLGTLAALDASMRRRPWLAGTLLGFTASLKYYPGLFLVHFLIHRQYRAMAAFIAAGVVCFAIIPVVLLGPVDWVNFHRTVAEKASEVEWIAPDPNSQNFAHVAGRWMAQKPEDPAEAAGAAVVGRPGTASGPEEVGVAVKLLGALGWGLVGLGFIAAEGLRRRRHPLGPALTASLLFLSYPFLLKTSWPHYFVYLPFCQAAVVCALRGDREVPASVRLGLGAFAAASILLSSIFLFNFVGDPVAYQAAGCLFAADALLLVPIFALGLGPWRWSEVRRGTLRLAEAESAGP